MAFDVRGTVSRARALWADAQWVAYRVRRRAQSRLTVLQRRSQGAPAVPVNDDGSVKVHLGCGKVDIPGFINVDAWPAAHVHHVHDVTKLPMFGDGSVDLVYACHVLEHIGLGSHRAVLWEWHRVLKPGGILRLSVPDFEKLLAIYEATGRDVTSIVNPLIGDEGYNRHACAIDARYLRSALIAAGFTEVRPWEPTETVHRDYEDWASKTIERLGRPWPISLNLEAVK